LGWDARGEVPVNPGLIRRVGRGPYDVINMESNLRGVDLDKGDGLPLPHTRLYITPLRMIKTTTVTVTSPPTNYTGVVSHPE
jgi:hypothetical protein